jgi:hypothetical protein
MRADESDPEDETHAKPHHAGNMYYYATISALPATPALQTCKCTVPAQGAYRMAETRDGQDASVPD